MNASLINNPLLDLVMWLISEKIGETADKGTQWIWVLFTHPPIVY